MVQFRHCKSSESLDRIGTVLIKVSKQIKYSIRTHVNNIYSAATSYLKSRTFDFTDIRVGNKRKWDCSLQMTKLSYHVSHH